MTKRIWDGKNLTRYNTVKQVKNIGPYRDYKQCIVLTPEMNPYFHTGYLDNQFFAFLTSVNEPMLNSPQEVIDYYLDNISPIFRNPTLEWNTYSKDYMLYMNSVKVTYESLRNKSKQIEENAT